MGYYRWVIAVPSPGVLCLKYRMPNATAAAGRSPARSVRGADGQAEEAMQVSRRVTGRAHRPLPSPSTELGGTSHVQRYRNPPVPGRLPGSRTHRIAEAHQRDQVARARDGHGRLAGRAAGDDPGAGALLGDRLRL